MTFGKASIFASVRAKIREVDVGDEGQAWCSGESCLTESPGRGL